MTLYWDDALVGGAEFPAYALQGAGDVHVITIPAMGTSGELEVSARQDNLYLSRVSGELEGRFLGTRIGGVTVSYRDDEPVPELSISADPAAVTEGSGFDVTVTATQAYRGAISVSFEIADPAGVLSGPPASSVLLDEGVTSATRTFGTLANTAMETEPRAVVFTLKPDVSAFALHTLDADASSATVAVLDNDTPPTAPQNLMAQAGDTEARLTWQPPTGRGGALGHGAGRDVAYRPRAQGPGATPGREGRTLHERLARAAADREGPRAGPPPEAARPGD